MKNQVLIDGKSAMPLRAVPLHAPGFITARDLIHSIYLPDEFPGVIHLKPFAIDGGQLKTLHYTEMAEPYVAVHSADKQDQMAQIECIPAGLLVWTEDAKRFFNELDQQVWETASRRCLEEPPRAWIEHPYILGDVRKVVMSNVKAYAGLTLTGQGRARDVHGHKKSVQEAADEAAENIRRKTNRDATKKQVVAELLKQIGGESSEGTLMREFKVTWKTHRRSTP